MILKDFQALVLFSSTFKALNLGEKNSSTFKYFQGCMETLLVAKLVLAHFLYHVLRGSVSTVLTATG